MLAAFGVRGSYIAQGEAFAPLLALTFDRQLLQSSDILLFVDNLAVVSSLCAGSARELNVENIVHGIFLTLAGIGSALWTEHVDSEANPSDEGSRIEGVMSKTATAAGVLLHNYQFPDFWPPNVAEMPPDYWVKIIR